MLTPETIAELDRLEREATPGPWFSNGLSTGNEHLGACAIWNTDGDVDRFPEETERQICVARPDYFFDGKSPEPQQISDNLIFIAALRNAARPLLDRLAELEAEIERLRTRLLSAAGDDLCRLTQDEIKAMTAGSVQIPPKEEFLASCERFHAQVAGEAGVFGNCLTLAQLVAENETLTCSLEWIARIPCKENPPCSSRMDYACDSCTARNALAAARQEKTK